MSLHGFNHIFDDLFSVAKDHHGAVHVKEVVIKACVACGHGAFVDDDGLGFIRLEDGHPKDGRAVGAGCGVYDVVGPQDQDHIGLTKLGVDVLHLKHLVIGDLGLG